ncbi:MAG: helix-turn-helix domain-containing protein [Alloprevotella sp.]
MRTFCPPSLPLLLAICGLLCLHTRPLRAEEAESVEALLTRLRQEGRLPSPRERHAAFAAFYREGLTDSLVCLPHEAPADTVAKHFRYWSAYHYLQSHRYTDCIREASEALQVSTTGHDRATTADCLGLLAIAHFRQGSYPQALLYAKACYRIDRESGNPDYLSSTLNTLAGICLAARQYEEAEKYITEALALHRTLDNPNRRAVLLGMASEVSHALHRDSLSLHYAREARELERKAGRHDKEAIRLSQMAAALIGLGRYGEARHCLQQAVPVLRTARNLTSLGIACNQQGFLALQAGDTATAARHYNEAARLFRSLHDPYNEVHAREGLYHCLRKAQPTQALAQLECLTALKDSIYNKETGEQLSRFNAEYDNTRLHDENRQIQRRHRRLRLFSIAGLCTAGIALLLAGLLLRRRKRRQARLDAELSQWQTAHSRLTEQYAHILQDRGSQATAQAAADDRAFAAQVEAIISQRIGQQDLDVEAIASQLCLSPSQFRRRLVKATGQTPQALIVKCRMQKARQLLEESRQLNVSEVALSCGFENLSNFSRAFKKFYGLSPTDYQRKGGPKPATDKPAGDANPT